MNIQDAIRITVGNLNQRQEASQAHEVGFRILTMFEDSRAKFDNAPKFATLNDFAA